MKGLLILNFLENRIEKGKIVELLKTIYKSDIGTIDKLLVLTNREVVISLNSLLSK